jgi:leader peptidase (prepilin peptidase)/N-methyltransferase
VSVLGLVACGVIGLMVGSFLNVVIGRVPAHESVVRPGSHCPRCQTPLQNRDNIPVVSWVLLRGRCRTCHEPISIHYPLIEAGGAILFVAAGVRFGVGWPLVAFCVLFAALLAISVIDLQHLIVPNRVLYPTLFIVAPLLVIAAATTHDWTDLEHAAIGGAGGFTALLAVNLVSPQGMGFGDVRLAGLIGMALGWISLGTALLGVFLAFLLGSLVGIGLIVTHIRGRKDALPFGPFLAGGAVIAALWGRAILDIYSRGRG